MPLPADPIGRILRIASGDQAEPLSAKKPWGWQYRQHYGAHAKLEEGKPAGPSKAAAQAAKDAEAGEDTSYAEVLGYLGTYVWPRDDRETRNRVLASLGLLTAGKLLNIQVPFLFKEAVDRLAEVVEDLRAQVMITQVITLRLRRNRLRKRTVMKRITKRERRE